MRMWLLCLTGYGLVFAAAWGYFNAPVLDFLAGAGIALLVAWLWGQTKKTPSAWGEGYDDRGDLY